MQTCTPINPALLNAHDIHHYGSAKLQKFEQQMARYFTREYRRWQGNKTVPEEYGVSSFEGGIAAVPTKKVSIEACYDDEYAIYRAFLDKDHMAYSAAYYGADASAVRSASVSLEQAQVQKYELIIERAEIEDGQCILDLGCGFGGFPRYLLHKFPNVIVTGINPSAVQSAHIKRLTRYHDPYFDSGRFHLVEKFIDDIAIGSELPAKSFDRVVSVGMLEHVTNIDLLFQKLASLLKPGGLCLNHCIVSIDTIPKLLAAEDTRIADYFPGGHAWPFDEMQRHNSHLQFIERWFINGMNYWRTLDEWHRRFWDSIDRLYPKHVHSPEELLSWNHYFSLCKAMFAPNQGASYGNGHFLYRRPG